MSGPRLILGGIALVGIALAGCSHAIGQAPIPANAPSGRSAGALHKSDYAILYRFSPPPDGNSPITDLVMMNRQLYGTTYGGGAPSKECGNGCGTVYTIDPRNPSGSYKSLYSFRGGKDGAAPTAGLNPNGGVPNTFFGTTFFGGLRGLHCYLRRRCGTVYEIDTSGTEQVLHAFSGKDGANPLGGRHYFADQKLFFGTTEYGGLKNFGAVYSVSASGEEHVVYSFAGGPNDGAYPAGTLASKCSLSSCRLYGVTLAGGIYNVGTIFSITQDRGTGSVSERVLHSFTTSEGDEPLGGLEFSPDGTVLYGAASRDGAYNRGSIFAYTVTPPGKFTIVHSFEKGGDGVLPYARPVLHNGALYGTTQEGGAHGSGTVYKITNPKSPYPQECVLHSFPDPKVAPPGDGLRPDGPIHPFNVNGKDLFFGTTVEGPRISVSNQGYGTVFQISPDATCHKLR